MTLLPFLSDLLLFAAALGAGGYCFILSRRLTRLSSFDKGLGGAIAVLSAQVDDMTRALAEARDGSDETVSRLTGVIKEAEDLANDLEVMLAACHDLSTEPPNEDMAPVVPDRAEFEAPAESPPPSEPERPEPDIQPQFGSRRTREEEVPPPMFRRARQREAAE